MNPKKSSVPGILLSKEADWEVEMINFYSKKLTTGQREISEIEG